MTSNNSVPAINDRIIFCVTRLKVFFSTEGGVREFQGTGFWIEHRGRPVLVTNRHNVDPELKFEGAGYSFSELKVELREWENGHATKCVQWFTIRNPQIIVDDLADCCLLLDPNLGSLGSFQIPRIPSSAVADAKWLKRRAHLMDRVFFIGYPLSPTGYRPWWDTSWNTPIAREASMASLPSVEFTNPLVQVSKTAGLSDVTLVSGHSFGGCSGSPVIHSSHELSTGRLDARVVGIMSGHLGDKDQYDRAVHGGLSFFTRSTSIWRLLDKLDH